MTTLLSPEELSSRFRVAFGRHPEALARAPGRVNLIGEHTDYNDGFVLPAAIERETRMAAAGRSDRRVHLLAFDTGRRSSFALSHIRPEPDEPWSNYVRGVAAGLLERGYPVVGMDAVIHGDVPIGSGLSSSAALEMAAIQAFSAVGRFKVPPTEAARVGQMAEHLYVGTKCGIMDQFASALGQADHALLVDCRDLSYQAIPIPRAASILIADTAVRRQLSRSAYNERRSQCETAARAMGVPALRDATLEMLEHAQMDELARLRATHVIAENQRVLDCVSALKAGDLEAVGQLMDASHASLRDLYEVSSSELDTMVELLRAQPGCYGARLTGAGFGGCAIGLLDDAAVSLAISEVSQAYEERTGLTPALYPTRSAAGAGLLSTGEI